MKQSLQSFILLIALTIGFTHNIQAQTATKGYKAGDVAIDFSLKNIDGKMISLADYKDAKGFIVIFTCNHCPFAQAYEQRIIDLDKNYAAQGYPVVAINPNDPEREPEDSYENMQKRASEKGYGFVYLVDQTQEIAKTYGATRTPHIYLLKKTKKGNIVQYVGAIDDNYEDANAVTEHYLGKAIAETQAGKTVSNTMTKAIGCGIKWRKSN